MDCLFCRIAAGDIPAAKVYEDASLVAFEDIAPAAPLHLLIIPREHIPTVNALGADHDPLVGAMLRLAARLAAQHGYAERGYRTVFNCNREAGQSVYHIHLHLLAGRGLAWPPG
jgi:histidine triad (HIT) family protein